MAREPIRSMVAFLVFASALPNAAYAQDVWHTISDAEIALTVFERVAGLHISTSATSDGQLQFWDWPTAETNPPVIRAEITVPAFTAVRGRYTVNSVDPITGVGTGPDDDAPTVTAWEPPAQTTGHQGYFAFGTDLEIVDGGGREGGDLSVGGNTILHIAETVVSETTTIRFQNCQSADHEGFSFININIEIRLAMPPGNAPWLDLTGGTGGGSGSTEYTVSNLVTVTASQAPYANADNNYYLKYLFDNRYSDVDDHDTYYLRNHPNDVDVTLTFDFNDPMDLTKIEFAPKTRTAEPTTSFSARATTSSGATFSICNQVDVSSATAGQLYAYNIGVGSVNEIIVTLHHTDGQYLSFNEIRLYGCTRCDAGSYNACTSSSSSCILCPAGRYGTLSGETTDQCSGACAAGRYGSGGSQDSQCTGACDAGRFSAVGAPACISCAAGKYTAETGAAACIPCQAGQFISVEGSVSACISCEAGKYMAETGATACIDCLPGQFISVEGSTEGCIDCGPGSGTNADQSNCEECMSGTVSATGDPCTACSAGKQPNANRTLCERCTCAAENTLMTLYSPDGAGCVPCALGKQPDSGATDCIDCPAGKAGNQTAGLCVACLLGEQPNENRTACELCPDGTIGTGKPGECAPCDPGTGPNSDSTLCVACPAGKAGSGGQCNQCSWGKQPTTAKTDCDDCPPGRYQQRIVKRLGNQGVLHTQDNVGVSCQVCPATTLQEQSHFQEPTPPCIGTTIPTGFPCAQGYAGKFCQSCDDEFYKTAAGECKPCADRSSERLQYELIAVVVLLLCGTTFYFWTAHISALRNQRENAALEREFDGTEKAAGLEEAPNNIRIAARCAIQPIRILFTYFQIVSQLGSVFQINFPDMFRALMSRLKVALNLFGLLVNSDCAGLGGFKTAWSVRIFVVPLGLSVLLLIVFAIEKFILHSDARVNFVSNAFFAIFLVYPQICNMCFSTFICIKVEDALQAAESSKNFLANDDRVDCDDLMFIRVISALVVLLFGLGVPVGFGSALVQRSGIVQKETPDNTNAAALATRLADQFHIPVDEAESIVRDVYMGVEYSSLIDAYQPHRLYWEPIDMMRKLCMVGFLVFLGRGTLEQLACAAGLQCAFIVLHVKHWPFKSMSDNFLRMSAEMQLFFTIQVAVVLRGRARESDEVEDEGNSALDFWMLATVIFFVVVPFGLTVMFKIRRALDSLQGDDEKASLDRFNTGMASKADRAVLRSILDEWADQMQGGREGSNLSFAGCQNFSQKFFVASFPGKYEAAWKDMTTGVRAGVLSIACVFFQDGSEIHGKHAEPDLERKWTLDSTMTGEECHCRFLADCAPTQDRSGTDWIDGYKSKWGCLWYSMWRHHVQALVEAGQRAVVIHQSPKPQYDEKQKKDVIGEDPWLGSAQLGEVQCLENLGIPVYYYSVDEYKRLVNLAMHNADIPEDELKKREGRAAMMRNVEATKRATQEQQGSTEQTNPVAEGTED